MAAILEIFRFLYDHTVVSCTEFDVPLLILGPLTTSKTEGQYIDNKSFDFLRPLNVKMSQKRKSHDRTLHIV